MKVKIGDITKIKTGKLDVNASSEDGEYPFFTCSKEPLRISTYSYDCECVLVAGNGDLNVKYYNGKFDAYQRTYIIEDNSDGRLFMPYLYYFVEGYVEELRKQAIGGVIKYIKLGNLTDAMIELPDVEIQKKIVNILSKTKGVLDSRSHQIDMLDNLIKARFVEMFDLSNCVYKSLGECTDFVDYIGHTPELSDEGTIRMINAKSVGKGFFKYVDEFITEKTYESWMHRGFGYPGDILFVTEGHTFGNICLIPKDMTKFALGQRVITIKGRDEIENAFLCSYMQTDMFWKDINVYRTGGTAQGIRSKDLIKVKAEYYIREHQDNEAIKKLKSNIPLSHDDIEALEKVLWSELGAKEDYEQEYGSKPLGELVREIVGLDMNAAKAAFSEYLESNNLDSRQIYFVNQIVEYIVHNGMMKDLSVLQESPFTDQGSVVEIFTDLNVWMGIRKVIESINDNAIAA